MALFPIWDFVLLTSCTSIEHRCFRCCSWELSLFHVFIVWTPSYEFWFIISTPLVRTSMFNRCTDFDTFYKESIAYISDHRNKLFNANIFSFCSYIFALRKQIFTLGGCQPLCFRICSGLWTPKFSMVGARSGSNITFKSHHSARAALRKHTGYLKATLQYQAHPNKVSTTNQFSIDHHSFPSPSSQAAPHHHHPDPTSWRVPGHPKCPTAAWRSTLEPGRWPLSPFFSWSGFRMVLIILKPIRSISICMYKHCACHG